jgi:CheY-like chemotaxis protein
LTRARHDALWWQVAPKQQGGRAAPAGPDRGPVLVVDDDADVRAMLCTVLDAEGFRVETAADGDEALVRMRRVPVPCVVLLDLNMPLLDAYGFRAAQRREPELLAIPVILYSGAGDVEEAAHALGIEAWLRKPFDLDRLLDAIERYAVDARP